MIWFFDSWFGGLQTMKYFNKLYPNYDYIFLADTKNCPYWEKTWEEIKQLTFKAINRLFNQWAEIVIVACNTAAAYSIRSRQAQYPNKKTLSITIPGIEQILKKEDIYCNVWIIATQATISSDIYNDLFHRFGGKNNPEFKFITAQPLVDLVEQWFDNEKQNYELVKKYTEKFWSNTKYLVLWCTHFPILIKYFQKFFKWIIIDPSLEAAKKFWSYLLRHPEIENKITKNKEIKFFTTWNSQNFDNIWSRIWWNKIYSKKINI